MGLSAKRNRILTLATSFSLAYSAAFIGSLFTMPEIGGWYAALIKSPLNPPGFIFGPVWTFLYACMAIAAWRFYIHRHRASRAGATLGLYGTQLVLNALWSAVFFGAHRPDIALAILALLWVTIAILMVKFFRADRLAGLLFIPYLLWVSFAAYLNMMIVTLN